RVTHDRHLREVAFQLMLRKPLTLLFAAAIVCSLAACGDDSGSLTAPQATSGSSGSQAPAASSGAGDTSSGSGSADTTAPNFSGSGGEKFCSQAKGFEDT